LKFAEAGVPNPGQPALIARTSATRIF